MEHEKVKKSKAQIELENLLNFASLGVASQCIEPTRYAYILLYQVSNICFLVKKHEKFIIMPQNQEMQLKDEVITKVHDVKYAPFKVLQQNDTFKIVLGNSIVSKRTFNKKEDAIKYINSKPYELITNLICITLELKEQYEKEMQEVRRLRKESEQNS